MKGCFKSVENIKVISNESELVEISNVLPQKLEAHKKGQRETSKPFYYKSNTGKQRLHH